jgi:hypothetical protein
MSGTAKAIGIEGMLAHYKVTMAQWTGIASHWNAQIPTNPQYMQFGLLVEQEGARIKAGGAPKPISLGAPAPAISPAAQTAMPSPQQMPGAYPQPAAWGQPQPQPYPQQPNPYAQQGAYGNPFGTPHQQNQFDRDLAAGFGSLGNAIAGFGAAVETGLGMYPPGQRVFVLWSDGNRYPGTVMMAANGQVQVAFPDGRQVWVPAHTLAIA